MYNTESCRLTGEEKLLKESVEEDFHLNNDMQTIVSKDRYPNIVECKSLLMPIDQPENNHPTIEKAETGQKIQDEKYKNNRTVSSINETTQNNSKVKFFLFFCFFFLFLLYSWQLLILKIYSKIIFI